MRPRWRCSRTPRSPSRWCNYPAHAASAAQISCTYSPAGKREGRGARVHNIKVLACEVQYEWRSWCRAVVYAAWLRPLPGSLSAPSAQLLHAANAMWTKAAHPCTLRSKLQLSPPLPHGVHASDRMRLHRRCRLLHASCQQLAQLLQLLLPRVLPSLHVLHMRKPCCIQQHCAAAAAACCCARCTVTNAACAPCPAPPLTRGQRLLELVGLVGVGNAQGVEVAGAPDLELGHVAALLDLHGAGILPPGGKEELLDLLNLLRLRGEWRRAGEPGRAWAGAGGRQRRRSSFRVARRAAVMSNVAVQTLEPLTALAS